jgi:ADP-ribose pyrophosphatase YjhB (NUDIX family)
MPKKSAPKFAPQEIFDTLLEWSVMPTFDVVLNQEERGILMLKRKIEPYKNQWALPGLRMLKGESIDDTLSRILRSELGLTADLSQKTLLGQYVGKFKTQHHRQDLSTAYVLRVPQDQVITPNSQHFSQIRYICSSKDIPKNTGAMYRYYLNKYFNKATN